MERSNPPIKYTNVLETGWPPDIIEQLHAALSRMGNSAKRFLYFGKNGTTKTELQLAPDLLVKCRELVASTGIRRVYVPVKMSQPPVVLFDLAAAGWLKRAGYSQRTIADIFGVSTSTAHNLLSNVVAGEPVAREKGNIRSTQFSLGMQWLRNVARAGDTPAGRKQVLAQYGAQRVIRVGIALQHYRTAHAGALPKRVENP